MTGSRVVVAIDDSPQSSRALDWALAYHVIHASDELHLLCVLPPAPFTAYPMVGGLAGGAAAAAVAHESDEVQRSAKEHAHTILNSATERACLKAKIPMSRVHAHALPAAGGASGVAESITEYVRALQSRTASPDGAPGVDLLVLGSRGMGALARSLMGLVGLGSVSDYAAHHAHCPVLVVHCSEEDQRKGDVVAPPTARVMVACDDSPPSDAALRWALRRVSPLAGGPSRVSLHLVAVAQPVPLQVLDEAAAVAAMEAARYRQESDDNTAAARQVALKYAEAAQRAGLSADQVATAVLQPEGASDIGAALCRHAKDQDMDLLVLGSRGMGALARSLMGLVGLGSVSDYAAHHAHCPVVIVKEDGGVTTTGSAAAAAPAAASDAAKDA